jgi:hypothetical protein
MGEITELSKEDKELMVKYNIKVEKRMAFYAQGYKYDKLDDAVRYARLSAERERESGDN